MERLRNIGPVSAERLATVGVDSPEILGELGSDEAYRRVKERFPAETSLNLLHALEGALLDLGWDELPPDTTERLNRRRP